MGSFRRIAIPNDITPKFLQAAQRNTGLEIAKSNYYIVSYLSQLEVSKHVVFSQDIAFVISFSLLFFN
jgi:hypothetical protein